jgi:hypothetical protein
MRDVRRASSEAEELGVAVAVGKMRVLGERRSTEAGGSPWKFTDPDPLADGPVVCNMEGEVAVSPCERVGNGVGTLARLAGFCMMLVPAKTMGTEPGSEFWQTTSHGRRKTKQMRLNVGCCIVTVSISDRCPRSCWYQSFNGFMARQ